MDPIKLSLIGLGNGGKSVKCFFYGSSMVEEIHSEGIYMVLVYKLIYANSTNMLK